MSLRDELLERTDVTCVGYGAHTFRSAIDQPEIRRVCSHPEKCAFAASKGKVPSAVVGFPFGDPTSEEIRKAILDGAEELDIPIPLSVASYLLEIRPGVVAPPASFSDWAPSLGLPKRGGIVYKFILHTDLVQKIHGDRAISYIKSLAGVLRTTFSPIYHQGLLVMKTCTGYGPGGATPEVVRALASSGYRVKASGGIRTPEAAKELLDAGADLLGISYSSFMRILDAIGEENGSGASEGGNPE